MQTARTVTYRVKCQENTALHDLILEKKQDNEEKGKDNLVRAFANAGKAVRNHPVAITNKGQFGEMKGVGPFILKQLGKYFDGNPAPQGADASGGQEPTPEEGPPAKKRKTAVYVPRLNSAPYAILITMYRALADDKDTWNREDLIRESDNSGLLDKPIAPEALNGEAGRRTTHTNQDYYTGWSSMNKQLIAKGLVLKQGSPARYTLTEYGEETARTCLQKSGLPDPLQQGQQGPAGGAANPPPRPPPPKPPAGTSQNPRSAAAAAAEARMAKNQEEGAAGPSDAHAARRSQQDGGTVKAGAARGGGSAGFRGRVMERPDLATGTSGEAAGGNDSDFEELDGCPGARPQRGTPPVVGEGTVQKLVCLGFSPVQARRALEATHVAGVPESPWVEQAANWLLENDHLTEPPEPKSPVRPSFQARMAAEESGERRPGRYDHLFDDGADPGGVPGSQKERPRSAAREEGTARAPGRPPTAPPRRTTPADGAGPSGVAQARHGAGGAATPLGGGALPLEVRVPPLDVNERFSERYYVICLVDHRELLARKLGMQEVLSAFTDKGLTAEARNLEMGDFLWIAKERTGSAEFVLDYVCERKRVDDLSLSIQSSRYQRQKHFLDTCGLRRRIYLLEDDPDKMDDHVRIKTACINTELVNGFDIQRTCDSRDTLRRLITLTSAIRDKLQNRTGAVGPGGEDRLPTFADFDKQAKSSRKRTVKDLWGLMLTQVGGIGSDSANVIMQEYPTAMQLYQAYRKLDEKPEVMAKQLVARFVRNAGGMKVGNKASENLWKFMNDATAPGEVDE